MRQIAVLLSTLALAACSTTPTELRGLTDNRHTFTTTTPLQPLYRALLERERECHTQNLVTAQIHVVGDLYPDERQATIATSLYGVPGTVTMHLIDLRQEGGATTVTTHFKGSASLARRYGARVERWARDGDRACQ